MDHPYELEPLNSRANEEPLASTDFHSDDEVIDIKESIIEVGSKNIEGSDILEYHDEHEETEKLISSRSIDLREEEEEEEERTKKKKSVSWIDERDETKDSVIFGAVTAVFVAPSSQEYDRSPSHRRKKQKHKHRRRRKIMMSAICIACLLMVGFVIFLVLLFGGFIRRET